MEKSALSKILRGLLLLALALPIFATRALPVAYKPTGNEDLIGDEIRWKPDFRLQWANFQARPDRSSNMDALTESGITFSWNCDWRGFQLTAYAIFVPTGSWVKEPTNNLLAHEQAHFDITEIHARLLRKFFAEHPDPCRLGRSGIDQAANKIIQASYAVQNEYDAATNHGENFRVQREWIAKIAAQLDALAAYAE